MTYSIAGKKYAFFNQASWGHKGVPVLVSMADMMHLIVAARHGGSHLGDPSGWPSGKDPTKDPAGTWGGTYITQDDLRELQRLAGKPDKRSNFLAKIPVVGNTLNDVLSFAKKIPVVGKILPYAGGPLAPLIGASSLLQDARGYITTGAKTSSNILKGGFL